MIIEAFLSRPIWVKRHVANHLRQLDAKLEELGFRVRTIGTNVTSLASPFEEVVGVMKTCHCAIILGLPYLRVRAGTLKGEEIEKGFGLPSEWNHIEAAVSLMLGLPTLMMLERTVAPRGLFDRGAANVFIHQFHSFGPRWVEDTVPKLEDLKSKVLAQHQRGG
ncbi:MAG: hypothetical protein A2Z38_00355 [Planctomycetes bacterium RBG_19FT_COMBO_48_8]|nr:MAG: hypothetical protein A2Z38_00355 [Planctomycetes bacterium RBG_19FT_COMBO_48_8]